MVSHPELGLDPPIGSDRESGCDKKCRINFAHCANFVQRKNSHTARIFLLARNCHASHFRPKTTPFCIFSNFTHGVITIDMGILVFHFFVRLYIAILCTVERCGRGDRQNDGALFLDSLLSLLSSPFLSLSRQPNTPLRMKTQGMLG